MTPVEIATAALTAPEWVAYSAWSERDVIRRYGNASRDGFLNGFREGVVHAGPSWLTITDAQRLEHIEACSVCLFCEGGRAWGRCSSCGDVKEALPPEGLSRCCGSVVSLAVEVS